MAPCVDTTHRVTVVSALPTLVFVKVVPLFHVLQSSSFFTSVPVLRGKVKGEGGTPKKFGLVRAAQGLKPLSYLRMRQLRSEKLNLKNEIQFKGKN